MDQLGKCLGRIRTGSGKSPVYITHGLQCDLAFSRLIAKYITDDRSIYGFQALGVQGDDKPLGSIEAMSSHYLQEMEADLSDEPFILVGFCAGGHIAMEMAHQFKRKHLIKHILLIDAPRHQTAQSFDKLVEYQAAIAERRFELYPQLKIDIPGAATAVRAYGAALRNYKSKVYKGKMSVLASKQTMPLIMHPTLGWNRFVPKGTPCKVIADDRSELLIRQGPEIASYIQRIQ